MLHNHKVQGFCSSLLGLACAVLVAVSAHAAEPVANSLGMEFVPIPAGSIAVDRHEKTASPADGAAAKRKITITRPFYLGRYEVTQAQWEEVMEKNPSWTKGPDKPVDSVSWNRVQDFIRALNEREKGGTYRLPTEAEWEYAARAGIAAWFSFGDDPAELGEYAWYSENSGDMTHPVGRKKPNAWGLYDMHGNVWELVQDWYGEELPEGTDPVGPESGAYRVTRGGGWTNAPKHCTSEARTRIEPDDDFPETGFRLVFMPD